MKILVTGASAFVGSNFLKKLIIEKKQFKFYIISRQNLDSENTNVQFLKTDLFNFKKIDGYIKKIKPDFLIHFAWITTPNSYQNSEENYKWLEFSIKLLKSFILNGGKHSVMIGSGNEKKVKLINETLDTYTITKHCLYLFSKKIALANNISFMWFRLPYMYGPMEAKERLVSFLIHKAKKNENIILHYPNRFIPLMHINDVVSQLLKNCFNNKSTVKDILPPEETNILTLAKKIITFTNSSSIILDTNDNEISSTEIRQLPVDVEKGLRQYIIEIRT